MASEAIHVLPIIEITVSPKFSAPKWGLDVQLRDIAHQIAMLLYGKKYTFGVNGCLGTKQQLLFAKNKLRESQFIIRLPKDKPIPKNGGGTSTGCGTLHLSGDCEKITTDIKGMVRHASLAGIQILVS
jgi:hypothetical protein